MKRKMSRTRQAFLVAIGVLIVLAAALYPGAGPALALGAWLGFVARSVLTTPPLVAAL
jgi:hypothetical protein